MRHGWLILIAVLSTTALISCNDVTLEEKEDWLKKPEDFEVPPPPPSYCQENPDDPDCNIIGVGHVATIFQQVKVERKVDIIWVIDNSGSMADEQASLAQNFNSFIDQFVQSGADFRIGITTTDTICSTTQRGGSPKDMGACGEFQVNSANPLPYAPILDSSMSSSEIKEQFAYNIQVGTSGSADEAGLKGALMSLENTSIPSSNNFNFLRDDAFLAIIIVSDENDISTDDEYLPTNEGNINYRSVSSYVEAMKAFKSNPDQVAIYSIVDTQRTATYNHTNYSYTGGTRYMEASNLTGGFSEDITDNFADALLVIGSSIANKTNKFHITDIPTAGTIRIFLNDVEIPNNVKNGWYYDEQSGAIYFTGDYIPDENDVMEIAYTKYIYGE